MRRWIALLVLGTLVGCGGGEEPAEEPAPAEPAAPAEPTAAEEPAEEPAADFASMSEEEQHAWLMEKGKEVYETGGSGGVACQTCHQANGEGTPPAFPPLAGAGEAMGDCKAHAGFIINGLSGEITVKGQTYNGVMPPQPGLSDDEIAAVISYERNSWGNELGWCTPADVAAARGGE